MRRAASVSGVCCLIALACGCGAAEVTGRKSEPSGVQQAPEKLQVTDTPQAIVAKAIEACGGVETFSRWRAGRIKYKTDGSLFAAMPKGSTCLVEGTFDYPDRFKRAVPMTVAGQE